MPNLRVKIYQATNIAPTSTNHNPYCRIQVKNLNYVSQVLYGTNNPSWNDDHVFVSYDTSKPFKWALFNEYDDSLYGRGDIDQSQFTSTPQTFTLDLNTQGQMFFIINTE